MALVFVHGIGNRDPEEFGGSTRLRDGFFRKHLLPVFCSNPEAAPILSPHWGTYGGKLRWNHASLPFGAQEPLTAEDADLMTIAAAAAPSGVEPSVVLTTVARSSVRDAIDLLFTCVDLRDLEPGEIGQLVDLAMQIQQYCRNQESLGIEDRYPWLADCEDDGEFVELLVEAAAPVQESVVVETHGGKGASSVAKKILARTPKRVQKTLSATAARGVRRLYSERAALLLGDVFAYLKAPDAIREVVATGIRDAAGATPSDEPLVVIAHSMGGNIVYDILGSLPKLRVDVLVTVGSQVGLFAELGIFESVERPSLEIPKVLKMTNVDHWINVTDENDILGYLAAPIFDGVTDYNFPTGEVWAHSAYFRQPNFHMRLAERIAQASS